MVLLQAAAGNGAMMSWIWIILLIGVFYFFMIRPQQKRQKELNKFRDELKKGDHVITTGGVYGKVSKIDGNKITLTVSENVDIVFDKSAIAAQAEA